MLTLAKPDGIWHKHRIKPSSDDSCYGKAMKKVAIVQSNYIPWKGYFDLIGLVDTFVVYDDVQYRKNHWHNRNLIKTHQGLNWLTIPVSKAEGAFQRIDSIRIARPFAEKHWKAISQAYSRAPFFSTCSPWLAALYEDAGDRNLLTDVNMLFIKEISARLGLRAEFVWSRDLGAGDDRTGRLVAICSKLGATHYLSGPSAANYLEVSKFTAAGIKVEWMNYGNYREYPQLHGVFQHAVSIVDLLMNAGPDAHAYMKSGSQT
jgi:hypothetical protein